jgi:hypothetical protein
MHPVGEGGGGLRQRPLAWAFAVTSPTRVVPS